MNYVKFGITCIFAVMAQLVWAQQELPYANTAMTSSEIAVESPSVMLAYSRSSGVVEIRFKECDGCEFRALLPAENLRFSAAGVSITSGDAFGELQGSAGTVFIDSETSKVKRVQYFDASNGGGK